MRSTSEGRKLFQGVAILETRIMARKKPYAKVARQRVLKHIEQAVLTGGVEERAGRLRTVIEMQGIEWWPVIVTPIHKPPPVGPLGMQEARVLPVSPIGIARKIGIPERNKQSFGPSRA